MTNVFQQGATEYYGPGARCINYQGGSKCHAVFCGNGQLQIKVGSNTITCAISESGASKSAGSETLICPDVNDFCNEFVTRCNNDCNANGLCITGGYCQCYTGWSGPDCSTQVPVDYAKITAGGFKFSNVLYTAISIIATLLMVQA
jgi:hypothetical protein